jgi:hypothetical protein
VSEADCFWNWARGLAPVEHSGPPRKDMLGGVVVACCGYCCLRVICLRCGGVGTLLVGLGRIVVGRLTSCRKSLAITEREVKDGLVCREFLEDQSRDKATSERADEVTRVAHMAVAR